MKLIELGNAYKHKDALELFLKHCKDVKFWKRIKAIRSFDMSSDDDGRVDGEELFEMYFEWLKWRADQNLKDQLYLNAVAGKSYGGMVQSSKPDEINIAIDQKGDKFDWAGIIMHETVHLCDYEQDAYFGHGGNWAWGKGDTAPYKMQFLFESYLRQLYKDNKPPSAPKECKRIRVKRPWWNPKRWLGYKYYYITRCS